MSSSLTDKSLIIAGGTVALLISLSVIVFCGFLIKYLDDMKKYDDEVSEQNKIIRKVAYPVVIIYVILTSLHLLFGTKIIWNGILKN